MTLNTSLHRMQTQAFINANPVTIVIERSVTHDDGAGGVLPYTPDQLDPQVVRKVGQSGQPISTVLADGRVAQSTHVLICMPDADIEPGDTFAIGAVNHEVLTVETHPEWRKAALIQERT